MANNKAALDKGFKKFQAIKQRYFQMALIKAGESIGDYIIETGTYYHITGNTKSSVAFAVYYKGSPITIRVIDPTFAYRPTLVKGEKVQVAENAYFTAQTGTESYYGDQEAIRFLKGYKPSGNGFSVVFCVGVRYAEYLENVRKHNVLTDAYTTVKNMGEKFLTNGMSFTLHSGDMPWNDITNIEIPF